MVASRDTTTGHGAGGDDTTPARKGVRCALVVTVIALSVLVGCRHGDEEGDGAQETPAGLPTAPGAYGPPELALAAPNLDGAVSLEAALAQRRSKRSYTDEPIAFADLGQLLWSAAGTTGDAGQRTAPSAGGLYPLEVYVVAGSVDEVGAGAHRYDPGSHRLGAGPEGDLRVALAEACGGQEWVGEAPMSVVFTGVAARTTQRYGERGVRYVHLEAGHAAQNLLLQATALGLGAVPVGACDDAEVGELLQLGAEESPLYVVPVGHPDGSDP